MAGGLLVTGGLLGGHAMWYLTRTSGVVLLVLLTATLVLGVLGPLRASARWWPTFLTAAFHRDISLVTLALVAVHVTTTVADGYAPIGWRDAVVPFLSPYRPLWLGLGTLALDLLLALIVTSLLRRRIGLRTWRTVHYAAYACWPVALAHGFGTGSDARSGVMQLVAVACTAAVLLAATTRLVTSAATPRARAVSATSLVMAPALLATWAVAGPLAPGWSARAGTRTAAAVTATKPVATPSAPRAARVVTRPRPLPSAFTARVDGAVSRTTTRGGHRLLDLTGALSGGAAGTVALRFDGVTSTRQLRSARRAGVYLGPPGDPTHLWGGLVRSTGEALTLRLWDRTRARYDAVLRIAVSTDGSRWAGTLVLRPHRATGSSS